MKGLIIKDFLNLRNNIKTMLITILIYLLFFISYDPSFLSGLLIMIFCLQSLSTFSYDEYANWDVFALSLPISRKELVLSKYIVFAIFPIAGTILSEIIVTGICLVKGIPIRIERGRMMMMVISFSLFGGIVLLGKFLKGILTPQRITHLETLLPLLPWIGIITLLIVAYFSYQLSSRIVLKKEY